MRHCCEFDALDIWYLKDDDTFTNKTLFIGVCPICKKHVAHLSQRNIKTNSLMIIKKVGEVSVQFAKELIKEIVYTRSSINKMKFKSKPYGWKYGVNKQKTNKSGEVVVKQYSADFYGNKELVREKTIGK